MQISTCAVESHVSVCLTIMYSINFYCLCSTVLSPLMYVAYKGFLNTTFQCNVTGTQSHIFWLVDNMGYGTEILIGRGITTTTYTVLDEFTVQATLTIAATEDNRNTTITCLGVRVSVAVSAITTFMVQGEAYFL